MSGQKRAQKTEGCDDIQPETQKNEENQGRRVEYSYHDLHNQEIDGLETRFLENHGGRRIHQVVQTILPLLGEALIEQTW